MNRHLLKTPSRRVLRAVCAAAFAACLAGVALAASDVKRYNVPAGSAATTLKQFSEQSGEQIVYPTDLLRDVQTRPVTGEHTARAALDQMLAGTGLVVVQDERTGALTIRSETDAATRPQRLGPAVKLEEYRVLGSRIRQTESAGPSPVNTYDQEYIRSTGAMTLADFLNYLPQNYTGVSAGRNSAPNELSPDFAQRTETTSPLTNLITGAATAFPAQTGVSGVSLRGLGSGSSLVLIDGRRAAQSGAGNRGSDSRQDFVDLNGIPFGMVDRVEIITDGASAIYGADAVGGVVNIVLKKDWVGHELLGSYRGAFHGGGRERMLTATSGFSSGKLRSTVSVSYFDRANLSAAQRSFSKNQDHRNIVAGYDANGNPIAGRDLRLNWGYPAVVQALVGTTNTLGTFNSIPGIRVVLVPEGAATTPTMAQFIPSTTVVPPASVVNASGQRRGNTAEFLDILPSSERYSFSGNFTYEFLPTLELYGSYSYTENSGLFRMQPALSSASATTGFGNFSTRITYDPSSSTNLSPFDQNVIVGMIHYEFGSIWQKSESKNHNATVGFRGSFGSSWEWDSGVNYQRRRAFELVRNFNGAAITAALNNSDPAQRLNPFIDARAAGFTQTAIYERMALYPKLSTGSAWLSWDFTANGDLWEFWGGPVRAALGGTYNHSENHSSAVNYPIAVPSVRTQLDVEGERDSYALFAEASVPFFGKPNARPLLRRLDVHLAGRYENYDGFGGKAVPKVGVSWVPFQPILFRASYSEGFRAPSLTEYQIAPAISNVTLNDPRRTPAATTGISATRGSRPNVGTEDSTTEFYGVVVEPPFVKGLTFEMNYYRTIQRNVVQALAGQAIVNNEDIFADRITRAAPDANDTALNQPGRITAIDLTFINFGEVRNRSLDFVADYRVPSERFGRWRINVASTRTLEASRQLAPGQPAIRDDGDTYAPPKWRHNASVFWNSGPWNGALFSTYIAGFRSNAAGNTLTATYPIPSVYKVDARVGYSFVNGVWRGYGKGLRLQAGIGNLFDKEPPFSDTVFGYNGGLHSAWALGRSYEFSFILPF